jgi:hypothetical protein
MLFFGCGGDNETTAPTATVNPPAPGPQLATLDASTAGTFAAAVTQFFVPGGRNSIELAGGNLSRIEVDNAAGALYELLLGYPALLANGNFRYSGPGGGNADVAVNGAGVTIQFNGFISEDGARLDGQVLLIAANDTTVSGNFNGLRVTNAAASYQIDGPGSMARSVAQGLDGFDEQAIRILNVTFTDLRNGGSARLIDSTGVTNLKVVGTTMTGTVATSGSIEFNQLLGLNGLVTLNNTVPFAFTIDLVTQDRTVSSGEIFNEGNGTLRRRVIATDTFEIAVRPPGATDFTVVAIIQAQDAD